MKILKILITAIILISGYSYEANAKVVEYFLELQENNSVRISFEIKGNSNGKTDFYYPILGLDFKENEFKCTTQSGKNCFSKSKIIEKGTKNFPWAYNVIKASHKPNEIIKISYVIENEFGVLASPNLIFFDSSKALVWPSTSKKITPVMSSNISFFQAIKRESSQLSLEEFFTKHYTISNDQLNVVDSEYGTIQISSIGVDKELAEGYLSDAKKILENNIKFISKIYGNRSVPNLKEVVIVKSDSANTSWKGIQINNKIIVVLNPKKSRLDFLQTMSHEVMHLLFSRGKGLSMNFGPNAEWNHFWFDEGFTDYYARKLNYQGGLISKEEYLNSFNKVIEEHYLEYRDLQKFHTNSCTSHEYAKTIFSASEFFRNYYLAGQIIALDLDNMIQKRTNNQRNLDDLIKEVSQKHCKKYPCNINKHEFISSLVKVLNSYNRETISAYVDKRIVDFKPIELSDLVNPQAIINNISVKGLSYGFNLEESFCKGYIVGIDESSEAYKVGLRNGMVMKDFEERNILSLNTELPWSVMLEALNESGELKSFVFAPKSMVEVPEYEEISQ